MLMKAAPDPYFCGIKMNETPPPKWILWGHLSNKGPSPAPTLIHVGSDIMNMLAREDFNKVGFILQRYGYQCVALDGPCYGFDLKPGEKEGLPGWRERIEKGEPFIEDFAARTSHLLDHLIKEGYTDPNRVVVSGSCRGGFLALHWAAREPRVKCVLAFTPLTDPRVVREFAGMENHPALGAMAIHNHVDKLADRAVWSCLGNADDRVGTDSCLAFMRKLMDAAIARNQSRAGADKNKPANVEFHLSSVVGHSTYALAHEEAATWVLAQMGKA
jgi:dienelactone hydrolase